MKKKKQTNSSLILQYYWEKAMKYRWLLVLNLFGIFLASMGYGFIVPLILKEIFDLMVQNSVDKELVFEPIKSLILGLAVTYIFCDFLGWRIAEFTNDLFQPKVMRDIEKDCFEKLQTHSFKFFSNNFSGGLVSKVNRFSRSFEMISDVIQWNLYTTLIRFLVAISVIFYFEKIIGTIFFFWTFFYILVSYFYAKWSTKFWQNAAKKDSKVTAELADSVSNIFNVKIFSADGFEKKRFWKTILSRQKARTKAWRFGGSFMRLYQAIFMISFEILVFYLMVVSWKNGVLSIGTIFAIQMFVFMIFDNLWNLGRQFQDYANALSDAEEMMDILQQVPDVLDMKKPEKCRISKGAIEFKKVVFQYSKKKNSPKVFDDFSLKIKAREKIGLVGESGAGKSTLVNLLLRFSDINSGMIQIDGQNIAKILQADLRKNIAYVPQESVLFHRSLAENIAYGKPEATFEEIIAVAKKAQAHEFILETSDQYETLVGERGVKLSGGQKQRIAIARAMLKEAPILILDEATSALDSSSEKAIQKAFEVIFKQKNKTTIVVAHRLSTLRKMDRIIVMDMGKIVEFGSHDQLLKNKGKYAELWAHQVGGFVG